MCLALLGGIGFGGDNKTEINKLRLVFYIINNLQNTILYFCTSEIDSPLLGEQIHNLMKPGPPTTMTIHAGIENSNQFN